MSSQDRAGSLGKVRLSRVRVLLLAAALAAVAGCAGDEVEAGLDSQDTRPGPEVADVRVVTLEQVLRDPRAFNEGPLLLRGSAYPREGGFVLVQDGAAIWVAAPAGTSGLERGEAVRVRAELERLTEQNAEQVAQALHLEEPGPPDRAREAISETPAEVGEPFLVLRTLRGEQSDDEARSSE